ncbi:putative GPI-anchored protein [Senna tora]|uniref:Putative GPI-anchored protein n=1 Tax=Senna tora TaxID=362788 RepID=A0A834W126_9FABA|nr:putative GPI-anchored protein [Senna tora]
MGFFQDANCFKGSLCCQLLFFFIWLPTYQDVIAQQTQIDSSRISSMVELAKAPSVGLFDPIEISPAVIPQYPNPTEPLPPMYPTFPARYEPVLTGKCPVKFSDISNILDKTASDCTGPLAALVGNVICCPQFTSLIHIFQGFFSLKSDKLVIPNAVADHCFSDIINILASRGANSTIPTLCSVKSSNLTGGSCPVKDLATFEKTVNTSKLLEACSTVDPLKECCRPICQPAIMDAALQISGRELMINDNKNLAGEVNHIDYLNDCKGVVYSYLSKKLSSDAANTAFRILSACKVNKVCPLTFKEPAEVISACRNVAAPSPSCCSSLNIYIAGIQKQMLITNKQAIICATLFGSMLRRGGVMTNIYELCDVDLKDFSIQAYGQQGCLLRSLPADVIFDNSTGISFTCDLSDNIAAPWPLSSSITSVSLCAPEMSLPALPTSQTLKNIGCNIVGLEYVVPIFSFFIFSTLLY